MNAYETRMLGENLDTKMDYLRDAVGNRGNFLTEYYYLEYLNYTHGRAADAITMALCLGVINSETYMHLRDVAEAWVNTMNKPAPESLKFYRNGAEI